MSNTNPDNVWKALNLSAPTPLSKKQAAINSRHNRTVRLGTIKGILRSFAKLNSMDQSSFGLVKVELNNKRYYYGVELLAGGKVHVVPIKNYPVGNLEAFLECIWVQTNSRAVGMVVSRSKVLPILNDGNSLIVGKWKDN